MLADPDDVVALIVASALTLVIFNVGGAALVWLVWRLERKARAREPGVAHQPESLASLYYVLSLSLWPASLALCFMLLGKARTARTGAICGTLGIAQVMAIAWIVCAIAAIFASDIVPWLP